MLFGLFSSCDKDACSASPASPSLSSLAPIFAIFAAFFIIAYARLLPLLESRVLPALSSATIDGDDHILPSHAPAGLRAVHADHAKRSAVKRGSTVAFSLIVALAAEVALLVVCEVADVFPQNARASAMGVAVPVLVFLLVVVAPALHLRSFVVAMLGQSFSSATGQSRKRTWVVFWVLMGAWLFAFYSVGAVVPPAEPTTTRNGWLNAQSSSSTTQKTRDGLVLASLARIGVIGVALTALLSGFAAVSAPWTTFFSSITSPFRRNRAGNVSEAAVARKQGALDATSELLATKRHRISVLETRISSSDDSCSSPSLVGKVFGTFRGPSNDEAEIRSLRAEISGLETMAQSLASQLSTLLSKRAAALRARTFLGRVLAVPDYLFAVYCVYRIVNTSLTAARRLFESHAAAEAHFVSDPISRALGLVALHWDPSIDTASWARQFSFLMSGGILLLSANSALQTAHILSRWAPRAVLAHARSNLPLLLAQILAVYVISAAMMLRSSLPQEARGAVADALGGGVLQLSFVDRWFETWFLLAGIATAFCIWVSGKLETEDEDEYEAEEKGMVKRS
ncbi:GPCR-type G protein 2 [Ceratocystis platani]|uniref:GPCR-type G protein 2 n=1 Tax=Ceratocystis fimbriata f. sp. platani TaxID=88771 RepID=A0A0F8B463_CERFI|nr:GPCR-type G protein 2 [Ceratocystis platani]